jgi:hypothetical protein
MTKASSWNLFDVFPTTVNPKSVKVSDKTAERSSLDSAIRTLLDMIQNHSIEIQCMINMYSLIAGSLWGKECSLYRKSGYRVCLFSFA